MQSTWFPVSLRLASVIGSDPLSQGGLDCPGGMGEILGVGLGLSSVPLFEMGRDCPGWVAQLVRVSSLISWGCGFV